VREVTKLGNISVQEITIGNRKQWPVEISQSQKEQKGGSEGQMVRKWEVRKRRKMKEYKWCK